MDSSSFSKEEFGKKHLDKVNGDFEFKDVEFSYGKKKVLKKTSFKVEANSTVAFVGKSGSGKTTVFNLLCKLYDIDSGKITIDGGSHEYLLKNCREYQELYEKESLALDGCD